MAFKDFTEMTVWQKAFDLLLMVYKYTGQFPPDEKYCLVSDMRRAAHSVTNNISEGFGRYEPHDKTRFYKIARGSCYELINQSLASESLRYIDLDSRNALIERYKVVINELDPMIKTIETSRTKP